MLAVAKKHAGKKLKCPKCGTASIVSVGSQLRRTEPPAIPLQDSSTGSSFAPSQRPLIIGGIVTGVVLMLVVMIGIWTNLNDAEQQAASEPPVDTAAAEEPTDDIAPADVQPLVEQPEPEPEPEPNIPDPKEQLKEAFAKLHGEMSKASETFLAAAKPLEEELTENARLINVAAGNGSNLRSYWERQFKENTERFRLLETQRELSAAKLVKAYIGDLQRMNIPETLAEEFEQDVISKALLDIKDPSDKNGAVLKRFQEGGPGILQTRVGRMWVMFGVRLTL